MSWRPWLLIVTPAASIACLYACGSFGSDATTPSSDAAVEAATTSTTPPPAPPAPPSPPPDGGDADAGMDAGDAGMDSGGTQPCTLSSSTSGGTNACNEVYTCGSISCTCPAGQCTCSGASGSSAPGFSCAAGCVITNVMRTACGLPPAQ